MAGPTIRDFATSRSIVEGSEQKSTLSRSAPGMASSTLDAIGIGNDHSDSARAVVEGTVDATNGTIDQSWTGLDRPIIRRKASIPPNPPRLQSWIPPVNYGAIEPGVLFRSAYPEIENYEYIRNQLRVKTILTLVNEPIPETYSDFMSENGICHKTIHVPANKDGNIKITSELMHEVLSFVLDRHNHPLLIHCNRGKHRTGCVTACFRKVLSHSSKYAIAEYRDYASPKERADDIRFIESFDPAPLRMIAQKHGWVFTPPPEPTLEYSHFNRRSRDLSIDEITNIRLPDSDYS